MLLSVGYSRLISGAIPLARALSLWSLPLALAIVATTLYGGYRFYSPIPYWDQWDGYIGFFRTLQEG
jgi:hypothetical protein